MEEQSNCDHAYLLLIKLLPSFELSSERTFLVEGSAGLQKMSMQVIERTPYTSLIHVGPISDSEDTPGFTMIIRAYHDARMAEVISCGAVGRLQVRFQYPNDKMAHPDEKAQLNRFMREWLTHSLTFGKADLPDALWFLSSKYE